MAMQYYKFLASGIIIIFCSLTSSNCFNGLNFNISSWFQNEPKLSFNNDGDRREMYRAFPNDRAVAYSTQDRVETESAGAKFHAYVNSRNPEQGHTIRTGDKESLLKAGLTPGEVINIYVNAFAEEARLKHRSFLAKTVYLKAGFANAITVTWKTIHPILDNAPLILKFASYLPATIQYMPRTCIELADFINFLDLNGFNTSLVHLCGASLGAHLAGCVGTRVKSKYGKLVGRITALDPTGFFLNLIPAENRIDKSSASFVSVFHSDINYLGLPDALGHVDFYLNGGTFRKQVGCSYEELFIFRLFYPMAQACAHTRAFSVFYYTIFNDIYLYAYPCGNSTNEVCEQPEMLDPALAVRAGEYSPRTARGKYYLPITESILREINATGILAGGDAYLSLPPENPEY